MDKNVQPKEIIKQQNVSGLSSLSDEAEPQFNYYGNSERARAVFKEYFSTPKDKRPKGVTIICNPEKPNEECVVVCPDVYKGDGSKFSDYLETHKIVKLKDNVKTEKY